MSASSSINLTRPRRFAAVFAVGCCAAALAHPVFAVRPWLFDTAQDLARNHHFQSQSAVLEGLQPWRRVTGAAIHLVPALLLSYGLLCARRSLAAFSRGELFDGKMADGLRDYAAFTFWAMVGNMLTWPVESVALTFANPPGQRLLSLGVSSNDLFGVISAGIVWVIASAIAQAGAVARENAQFV